MAVINDVARDFTAMLRAGQFDAAGARFRAADVKCSEPDASRAFGKGRIDELGIDGPFVTGDQFALFLDMLITDPANNRARPFTEIAIYTVRDGRIIEERFFYD